MRQTEREDIFETSQLNIAAYLFASGLPLQGNRKLGKSMYFQFGEKEKAEQLVSSYFAGKATTDPQDLFAKLNTLRDLIFSSSYEK